MFLHHRALLRYTFTQVDRNLVLYLLRLADLANIVADRPGAWFPGPLDPYPARFPSICLSRDFKRAKVPGTPLKSFLFWRILGVIYKKKLFSQADSLAT